MPYYINCIKQSDSLLLDIKELITDANLRRRMSRVIKMGVSTGIESLLEFDNYAEIDAIITGTGLGCVADSEKFLANIIHSKEQLLNPTPFIQSTFNTIGGQIALIRSYKCYNNTFSHRFISFESALLDAVVRLDNGMSKAVLVGVFDEATPTVEIITRRIGLLKHKKLGEGAIFFVLTKDKLECSVGEIHDIYFDVDDNQSAFLVSQSSDSIWCGAVAKTLVDIIERKEDANIVNDIDGKNHSLIKLKCL